MENLFRVIFRYMESYFVCIVCFRGGRFCKSKLDNTSSVESPQHYCRPGVYDHNQLLLAGCTLQ